ncbi:MAG: patatin-like phospholipase family protein [Myxococcota bacterium]
MSRSTLRRALVLSGGGARGAYEVGVLAYLYEAMAESLERAPLEILCGTSVGANNPSFLAAHANAPKHGMAELRRLWHEFDLSDTLRIGLRDLSRIPWDFGAVLQPGQEVSGVLINSRHLQRKVVRSIRWGQIRRNLRSGVIRSVSVSTTEISSGRTVVFVDRSEGGVPPWSRDKRVHAVGTRLGPVHALASAAIPFIFPSIRIDGRYYTDGSLRQATPLSPAVRLGADRVLVVGVRQRGDDRVVPVENEGAPDEPPGAFTLGGKLLNALLLDRLDYDLRRLEDMNTLLIDGERTFGPKFIENLHETTKRFRHQPYRIVDTLSVYPTGDMGTLATQFIDEVHPTVGGLPGWLLSRFGQMAAFNASDIMSYLLFDGRYAEQLIEMGYSDAHAMRDELEAFFRDDPLH